MNLNIPWLKRIAALIAIGFLLTACSSPEPPLDDVRVFAGIGV